MLPSIVAGWPERAVSSQAAMDLPEFRFLGLTDAAILLTLDLRDTLVTIDVGLHLAAANRNLNTINFNHVRFP